MTIIGRQSGPDFSRVAECCRYLERPYLLLGELRAGGALGPQALESFGANVDHRLHVLQGTSYLLLAVRHSSRATLDPKTVRILTGRTGPFLFHGHNWPATRPGSTVRTRRYHCCSSA